MGSDNQCNVQKQQQWPQPEEVNDFREPWVNNLTENWYFQKLFFAYSKEKKACMWTIEQQNVLCALCKVPQICQNGIPVSFLAGL